jgi:hypothetical protein
MGNRLSFRKLSRNDIFIDNIFYGREINFSFPGDSQPLSVEIFRHEAKLSTELALTINGYSCTLYLENLPPLGVFSEKFQEIDLPSVPEAIRLLVLQTALENLCEHFASRLKTAIGVEAINFSPAEITTKGLTFIVHGNQKHLMAGMLVVPKEVLVLFAKKMVEVPRLRDLRHLEMPYHVCLGKAYLTPTSYGDLREEDIIFLDQHELTGTTKMGTMELGEMSIHGDLSESGIIVRQIAGVV